jgi:hypothetical protein
VDPEPLPLEALVLAALDDTAEPDTEVLLVVAWPQVSGPSTIVQLPSM